MQNDEQEIRQLVSTWMAASKAGDIETVLSLMSDDVVFLVPGQPVMRKADFAAAARAQSGQETPQFDGTSEIQELKILGDWAFMWTKLTVVVTPPGGAQSMTRAGHTLTILKKESGRWVLARDANMLALCRNDAHQGVRQQKSINVPITRSALLSFLLLSRHYRRGGRESIPAMALKTLTTSLSRGSSATSFCCSSGMSGVG